MLSIEKTQILKGILEKIGNEKGIKIKLVAKEYSYCIFYEASKEFPFEKTIITFKPKENSVNETDIFDVTFGFDKETTLMLSNPRKCLETADEIIEEIKRKFCY